VGVPEATPTPEPVARAAPGRVAVVEEPDGTAVAAALVFPGSGWELPGTEGLTLLAAETLLEGLRVALAKQGARAWVRCDRAAFTFFLLAPPDRWSGALEVLLDGLFRPDPRPDALATARSRLYRTLSLDQASPAWQARLAARQALHGDTIAPSPGSAPGCGVPETLGLFRLEQVRAASLRFAPRLVHGALVGPVDPARARDQIARRIPDEPTPPLPSPRHTGPGRRYVERNTVTAWTGHAFPFGGDVDEEAVRFLGGLLEDAFAPGVSRPDVLAVHAEIERHGSGGALIVHLVTRPDAAADTGAEVETRLREVARDGIPAAVWDRLLRRYRGARLLEAEAPESRAEALARGLAFDSTPDGGWPGGWPDPGSLTPARVRAAAAALGAPARSVVGPRSARSAVAP
jgi:predicted Zn-dependent peptidase